MILSPSTAFAMAWAFHTSDDVRNMGPQIAAVAIFFTVLSLSVLALRFYVRAVMIKAIGPASRVRLRRCDNCSYVILDAHLSVTVTNETPKETKWGLGLTQLDDMPPQNIFNFGFFQYMGAPFNILSRPTDSCRSYITSILGFKLSLLFSYLRFMPKGIARISTILVMVACVLFHLSFLLVQVNLCQPIAKQWNPAITSGQCIKGVPFYLSMASITIFFDVIVMFLPFPILLKSRIQKRKKFALLGLLALGTFITIIQIIRIQTISNLSNYLDSGGLIMWSTIENNLGIIVASIPTLAPLFKYFVEKTTQKSSSGTTSKNRSKSTYTATKSKRSARQQSIRLDSFVRGAAPRFSTNFEAGGSEEMILEGAVNGGVAMPPRSKDVGVTVTTVVEQVHSPKEGYHATTG
ncbi:integral membrane [Pyrenophora seminiperda CCB06]|uniref:Integral membrane n=1 Tax=Pyrenophora seminiperda CCB06 TaxID=1302712 RepID=A0A3M7M941_9PLEO|nr:integral membrane [Pyrenophora seminiperda CCB06]